MSKKKERKGLPPLRKNHPIYGGGFVIGNSARELVRRRELRSDAEEKGEETEDVDNPEEM